MGETTIFNWEPASRKWIRLYAGTTEWDTMESYTTKMNPRPDFFEPAGTFRNGFNLRMWTEMPKSMNELLYEAVQKNDSQKVLHALRMGADPNMTTPVWPLMHYGVEYRNVAMLDALQRFGGDVNAVDSAGYAPLHKCATSDVYLPIARFLLEMGGADPMLRDAYSRTPHHIALEMNNTAMSSLFEELTMH